MDTRVLVRRMTGVFMIENVRQEGNVSAMRYVDKRRTLQNANRLNERYILTNALPREGQDPPLQIYQNIFHFQLSTFPSPSSPSCIV